jgi:hypothetical protein
MTGKMLVPIIDEGSRAVADPALRPDHAGHRG